MAKLGKRGRKAQPQARRKARAPRQATRAPAGIEARRIDLVMRAVNEGVYDWDIAGGTIYYSEGVHRATGMSPRHIRTPEDWRNRIHPEDLPGYDAALIAHFKGKTERFECDYRFRDRKGGWRWARQHGIAERDAAGRAVRLVGSTGDITGLKQAEQALREAQERLALATQAATEGIYEWNLATGSLFLSDRAKAYFAVKGGKLTPAAWNALVLKEDIAGYQAAIAAFFKSRRTQFEHEYRLRKAGGGQYWILDRAVALRDAKGRVTRLVGAIADITPRKLAESQLRRARDEATEALERQTATAEILKVIASSPSDVQPVLDAIVHSARKLFDRNAAVRLVDDGGLRRKATSVTNPEEFHGPEFMPIDRNSIVGIAVLEGKPVQIADTRRADRRLYSSRHARDLAYRAVASAPLLREGVAIGVITVSSSSPGALSESHMALLATFADQAVIAIENARLFNETREALERQTATSEILKVIASSPSDVEPVFEAIVRSFVSLSGGLFGAVFRFDGSLVHFASAHGFTEEQSKAIRAKYPVAPDDPSVVSSRAILTRASVVIEDIAQDRFYDREHAYVAGWRRIIAVPMLREGVPLGAIVSAWTEPGPIPQPLQDLLKTFADQAVIAIENVRLFNETKEALEQQRANAGVLQAISGSISDTQPVFDRILESCERLFSGSMVGINIVGAGGELQLGAYRGEGRERFEKVFPLPANEGSGSGACILRRTVLHYPDVEADATVPPATRAGCAALGIKSVIFAPMISEGAGIGAIFVGRRSAVPFTERETDLLKGFADQAAIAIKNVRLFNETREALERQTATAEILKVIAASPSDVQPVFDAIAASATRLLGGFSTAVVRVEGDQVQLAAFTSTGVTGDEALKGVFPVPVAKAPGNVGRAIREKAARWAEDIEADLSYTDEFKAAIRARGWRSGVAVPMVRAGEVIGAINVTRQATGAFTDHQIGLLQAFADQAVIAIENVRLFNETKEALERQTATAEILKVIASSPSDVQPVFEAIADNAKRLLGGFSGMVLRFDGELLHLCTVHSELKDQARFMSRFFPISPVGEPLSGRCVLERAIIQTPDLRLESDPRLREIASGTGVRAVLVVPMLRDGAPIGTISVARTNPGAFSLAETELLTTFADQAVIAIENVRLFNETKEALERQTATAEILNVIAGSPSDVQPVFDAIAKSAYRLIGGFSTAVARVFDDVLHLVAFSSTDEAGNEALKHAFPMPVSRSKAARTGEPVSISDTEALPESASAMRDLARARGFRSILIVPMRREGVAIGTISVTRREPAEFSFHQVDLLKTFADQAVIAIENVRLFNETKEALERQTATAEILQVISSSPTDTQPVFDAIVRSGMKLFSGASSVIIGIVDGDQLRAVASAGEGLSAVGLSVPISRESAGGIAILERRLVNIRDTEAPDAPPHARENARRLNIRSMIHAPMFREAEAIGTILVTRREPGGLDDKQLALLKTFADQAVIAIENVRLFKELQSRTEALTKSVGQLTALGEVGQAISSTLDLETVLQTIVSRAVQLTGMDAGSIYEYDEQAEVYRLQAAEKMAPELVEAVRQTPIRKGDGATGRTAVTLEPVQVADIQDASYQGSRKDNLMRTGYRAVLAVPLLREDHLLGALQVFRRTPGEFAPEVVELLKTFATQSAMAIQNARLFREIAEKGRQLEEASRHKSNFLASMSHELRTPLNAILGFNEMLLGQVYGEVPADMQEPLKDIQASGKHLLRLINNVLDLAKIEAGRMELSLSDYSVQDTVESVRSTLRPLAAEKGLEFLATVPNDVPLAYGDGGRITQCLMNLAGNSLKFTKAGRVEISAEARGERLLYKVSDTGIGIPPDKIASLFTEFKQTDATIASEYGGTGLGLSISKKFVEMHGGRIWVESEIGKGSAFMFEIPLRVNS
jgi:PAS domain S-box-containing protein